MHDRFIHIVQLDIEYVETCFSPRFPREDVLLTDDPWCIGIGRKDGPINRREVG